MTGWMKITPTILYVDKDICLITFNIYIISVK